MVWFGLILFDNRPQLKIAFFRGEEIFSQEFTKINPLGMHFFWYFPIVSQIFPLNMIIPLQHIDMFFYPDILGYVQVLC